jgi:hypothetical protein
MAMIRFNRANRRNVVLHPNATVNQTNGVAAAIFPADPAERKIVERVAK